MPIVHFPIAQARRGDYCTARIACYDSREAKPVDTAHGRYWKCEIIDFAPKGILKVKTRGHRNIQLTHTSFVLQGIAWGSRMREEIDELRTNGHLIERPAT